MTVATSTASAHTDSDFVAVPALETAQVTLKPTHGCDGSPTIEVATKTPVEGAEAVAVEGWSTSTTPDGDATILEWTGGSLPTDQIGEFPVRFTVPDRPGDLLTFPFVQVCDNGQELAWIDGDPGAAFPAPRLLVLPPGYDAAATIEDVPADAPGRNQLAEIVDVDNPAPTAASTTAPTTTPTSAPPEETTTSVDATDTDTDTTEAALGPPADNDGGSSVAAVFGVLAAGAAVVAAVLVLRRRGAHRSARS